MNTDSDNTFLCKWQIFNLIRENLYSSPLYSFPEARQRWRGTSFLFFVDRIHFQQRLFGDNSLPLFPSTMNLTNMANHKMACFKKNENIAREDTQLYTFCMTTHKEITFSAYCNHATKMV